MSQQSDFNIGDNLHYFSELKQKNYIGKVIETTPTFKVQFEQSFAEICTVQNNIYIGFYHYFVKGLPYYPTKEELILKRIKILWNKSNYIKTNPSQAY